MARSLIASPRIRGLVSCVPARRFSNLNDTVTFPKDDVRKVVAMAGVTERRIVGPDTCSTDLCFAAATSLIDAVGWRPDSIDGLIMVTQTPDYFMPSSSCLLQARLGLSTDCAVFDVGLGCSGYVYGLWLAAMMLGAGTLKRVLLLHGETPTLYANECDRAVSLLFGDAGAATALEANAQPDGERWAFAMHTDGAGANDLIIRAGGFRSRFSEDQRAHYVEMNGANVFNFTIRTIPPLIDELLALSGLGKGDVDYYIFHQSNRFIINHLVGKCGLPPEKVPVILPRFGNSGGPSVPLAVTQGIPPPERSRPLRLMLLGYGVGLSWAGALLRLEPDAVIGHVEHVGHVERDSNAIDAARP